MRTTKIKNKRKKKTKQINTNKETQNNTVKSSESKSAQNSKEIGDVATFSSFMMNVYWCKDTSNDNFKKLAKFLWQGIMPGEWKPSSEEAMEKSLKSFCKAIKNVRPYSFTLVQNFDLGKGNYMSLWDFS